VTTDEGDCIEVGYIRGGNVAAAQALVPDRFTIELLAGTGPARVRLFDGRLADGSYVSSARL
jgi:hypothetical protein